MAVFTVVFAAAVFLLAGLLVDGGAAINARLRAADIAEQGARAAADEIDVDRLRETGRIVLRGDAGRGVPPRPRRSSTPRARTARACPAARPAPPR